MTTEQWSRDYARIERALSFIEENIEQRPGLAEAARRVGLSEYHFQRLFSRMVGISPKRYEQFLSKEKAKALLERSASLLDASYEAGLSGPGRLHDLFVSCEAVTPGEFKTGGRGLAIRYGFHATPFGECLIAVTARGVCGLSFVPPGERARALESLAKEWRNAAIAEDAAGTGRIARRIFSRSGPRGRAAGEQLPLLLRGTNFQIKVWEALLAIPPGSVTTYEAIARRIDRAGSARAVGNAVGRNPIAYLIPCHRVIRASGELGGYRWGTGRKRLLLACEAERSVQAV
ncbi:MAG: methylated-DNA--[protein]-cysteine S-methyltransferase [Spirochaetes bacterium]|nr:methylated-DNA--[protein]-cysteine S-methyltransferase [Spirochaetota bacterium]